MLELVRCLLSRFNFREFNTVKIKPFSGLYYYNKYSKANNVSRFVNPALDFDCDVSKLNLQNELNVSVLQNFINPDGVNESLKNWLRSGVLTVSGRPSFYVCEMTYKVYDRAYTIRGFFAAMSLPKNDEFSVKKIENVDEKGTSLILNLLQKINFQTSSVFALYDEEVVEVSDILKNLCTGPCFEKAKHSHVSYKVWEVVDTVSIRKLQENFQKLDNIILVGGAEVYEAVLANYRKNSSADCVLTFFVEKSNESLAVLPLHRIVSMSMFDLEASLKKLSVCFKFVNCKNLSSMRNKMFGLMRDGKRVFGIYAEDSYGVLILEDDYSFENEISEPENRVKIDSFIVDEFIFKRLLRLDEYFVQFTSSARAAKMAVDNGDGCFVIFLNSPRLSDLEKVSSCCGNGLERVAHVFPRPVDGLVFYSAEN